MKRIIRISILVVFAGLGCVHVVVSGPRCAATLVWRLRRYSMCDSNLQRWREEALEFNQTVLKIESTTPPSSRITVCGPESLANEISFYAFPRVVVLNKTLSAPDSKYVVQKTSLERYIVAPTASPCLRGESPEQREQPNHGGTEARRRGCVN